jgi:two-component system LytT family sensor kinase
MNRKTLIIAHTIFWLYQFLILEIVMKLVYKASVPSLQHFIGALSLTNYLIFAVSFYINYFFILPYIFKRKRYVLSIVLWVLLCIFFVLARYLIQEYFLTKYFNICNYCDLEFNRYFLTNFLQCLTGLIFPGTMIWLIDSWFGAEKQKLVLIEEKLKAESAFLQSQLTPHFLFNNLHTIYSMVFHHSDQTLPAIKKLSDILRYSINESRADHVKILDELEHLDNFIGLQKLRVIHPAIELEIAYDKVDYPIQPLLLITLVENAFKHGISNDPEYPIKICFNLENNVLIFTVENKINPNLNSFSLGTGLGNVKKRLELYYHNQYEFHTNRKGELFFTYLKLNLAI